MKNSITLKSEKHYFTELFFCMLFLLPFLEPGGVNELLIIRGGILRFATTIFFCGRIAVLAIMILFMLSSKQRLSKITLCISGYYLYMMIVYFIKHVDKNDTIANTICVIGLLMLLEFYYHRNWKIFVKAFIYLAGTIVFLNMITVLLFPDGMYENMRGDSGNWLLGHYNSHFFLVLPWLTMFTFYSIKKNKNLRFHIILITLLLIIVTYLAGSRTSSISLAFFLLTLVTCFKIKKISLPGIGMIITGSAILSYLMVWMRIQECFSDFIHNVLHRDVTLTGRTSIWDTAINMFWKSPIIGNGAIIYKPNLSSDWSTTQAHNTFLNVLVNGGVIGIILFLLIFILIIPKIRQINQHPYAKLLTATLLAYGVSFLTEMFQLEHIFMMLLFFSYHINDLVDIMPVRKRQQKIINTEYHQERKEEKAG